MADLWETNARWWQEGYTKGADPEYEEQVLPLAAAHMEGATRVLDLGCGEGQVARIASYLPGVERVTGVDPTWGQITAARERGGAPTYARAGAGALPFAANSFDRVVACLVFEHIRDIDTAFDEVARVLEPGGRFVLLINHPLLQTPNSGWVDDQILDPPEQYWRIGPYLVEDERLEEVDKGVFLPFVHRPLSRYVNAMLERGMTLRQMEEPAPPPGFLAIAPEYPESNTIPRLMVLDAVATR
jgi:SAM-dependent methyltransferase